MTIEEIVHQKLSATWSDDVRNGLTALIKERYGLKWEKQIQIRINGDTNDDKAPFAAFIPAGQPSSGPYGGMSFVLFPSKNAPALVALGVGTNGLAPDEQLLGRPGHARKLRAITSWINKLSSRKPAWSKNDPVRIDQKLPVIQQQEMKYDFGSAIEKYGSVLYATYISQDSERDLTTRATLTLLDLFCEEHGLEPLSTYRAERDTSRTAWLEYVLPLIEENEVYNIIIKRRFVILEGPPGTGKTRMAQELLKNKFNGNGKTIQFHPTTTYESFIGGLAPVSSGGAVGLTFAPKLGYLLESIIEALKNPNKPFLLHIDEINRADLAKVLGEAIYLFEADESERTVTLSYDFGPPIGRVVKMPKNLFILGTMNSADRSIAILDIAVRRRFAFIPILPDFSVLQKTGASDKMKEAFEKLFMLFLDEANEDSFSLIPGHAYFMDGGHDTDLRLQTSLKPLLTEYLSQGYVAGFADEIRAYLDWIG